MKISNILSLLIASGSLAVSIFVYFQSQKHFEQANRPFLYIEESLEGEKLSISLQNIVGSDVLRIDDVKVGEWSLFRKHKNELYNFFPNEKVKNRPIGPGERIDLLSLELRNPDKTDEVPDNVPLSIIYRDRSDNLLSKKSEISMYILKNAIENKNIKRQLRDVNRNFKSILDRNRNIIVPDNVRRRMDLHN